MIIIKTLIKYTKLISIFTLVELFICFLLGFFRLLGLASSVSSIILLIINLFIFFIYGFIRGKTTSHKGLIEGLITGSILIAILFVISLIFYLHNLSFATLFYYIALLFMSIIGGTFGKNKKEDAS